MLFNNYICKNILKFIIKDVLVVFFIMIKRSKKSYKNVNYRWLVEKERLYIYKIEYYVIFYKIFCECWY